MKHAKWFLLAVYFCLAISCGKDKPGKNGVLTIDKMKRVMWDIMQVDEFAHSIEIKDSAYDVVAQSDSLYQKVFGLHKISSETFYKSFRFYRDHPDYFKILLDSMSAFGNRERDSGFYRSRQTPPLEIQKSL